MVGAIRDIGRNVVKENKGVVAREVGENVVRGAAGRNIFLVGFPGNARVVQQCDEMIGRHQPVGARELVIDNTEVCPGFHPEIIGFAGMKVVWSIELCAVGGHRQNDVVNVGTVGAALNVLPVLILHDDYEDG